MADSVHNAVVGGTSVSEVEILGGPGPHFERDYPKGTGELTVGQLAAISDADGLVYAYDPADTNLDIVKGVVSAPAESAATNARLLVFGHINRTHLKVGASAADAAALLALEDRHIYPVG